MGAGQSDEDPIDDASSGAVAPDDAMPRDANKKVCSGPKPKPAMEASDIQGLRHFGTRTPLPARLHDIGTERDKAGNPELHMDEYCMLQLLRMFSLILTSLRALQPASKLDKVRKKQGVERASLGSLSESVTIFDPEPLKEIAAELIAEAYRLNWLIELFFRMFKQLRSCRHLLSTKQNGVEIQTHIAIIVCLLILIHTGRAPTNRTYEMICRTNECKIQDRHVPFEQL